jgi:hypothetical protein
MNEEKPAYECDKKCSYCEIRECNRPFTLEHIDTVLADISPEVRSSILVNVQERAGYTFPNINGTRKPLLRMIKHLAKSYGPDFSTKEVDLEIVLDRLKPGTPEYREIKAIEDGLFHAAADFKVRG